MSSWPENKQFPKLSNYFGKLRLASPSIHKFVILRENLKLAGRPDDRLNDKNSLDPTLDKKSLFAGRTEHLFCRSRPKQGTGCSWPCSRAAVCGCCHRVPRSSWGAPSQAVPMQLQLTSAAPAALPRGATKYVGFALLLALCGINYASVLPPLPL